MTAIQILRRRSRATSYCWASIRVMAPISIMDTGGEPKVPEQIEQWGIGFLNSYRPMEHENALLIIHRLHL